MDNKILTHSLCSIIQLACILALLGLQITLTITQTCAFPIGVVFWSFPFLLISPISIWILLWKRNLIYYYLTFIIHFCSNLFATTIIIISFLSLIGQIQTSCSTTNSYHLSMNISLISISIFLKLFLYGEILFLYILQHHYRDSSTLLADINTKTWNSFQLEFNKFDDFDV
jgi:hypothetical protein